ncbi:MAG: PCP degradation transcriptional activation protein [Paracidovorax wautersii]|uniref:PCP degradation transcriptional activation protein n=1 Tax=Paracidovorax wautersii TaxID=1177982 RepID=A0A7V8FRY0_9BURK|nr:MAG: PCP degradation transcriptional activation protein [Paracidovorax wautersii]
MKELDLRFDLNLLRVLVALHRWRSVSKAAEALQLSQPATSLALGRLRKAVHDPLFVRSRSGMVPTSRCSELAEAAAKALSGFNEHLLNQPAFDPATSRRDFVVAAVDVGELHFLPRLMVYLHHMAPHCNLQCKTFALNEIETAMEEGRCDLALGLFAELAKSSLHVQHLSTQRMVCLVRQDHPTVRSSRVDMAGFLALSHVVVRPTGLSQELFESRLKAQGGTRRVQLVTEHFMAVPSIIAATDLIVTVPRPIADYYARIEKLRVVEPPINIDAFPVSVFWHPCFHLDPAVRWLRESIIHLFRSDGT